MPTKSLNPEQVAAVSYGDGPLLIIAGAGTGKTTVITERISHLILERNISPSHILSLTFTDKAASEMEERIDVLMPYGYTQTWIATFHGFCDRILRQEAIHIGLDSNYTLATEAEMVLFLRKNLYKFNLDYFRPLGNPTKFIQGMLQHFSRLQDEDITPEDYAHYAEKLEVTDRQQESVLDEIKKTRELASAYKLFEELKIKEGILDFSNLISNTLKLFRTRKNILMSYQKQFQYILIDEFQDTNFAQNELGILLAGEKKNITVVGDDDQAIYRWRGAAVSNMIHFRKHFKDVKIITLTKNYRSTQTILDSAYTFIQHNNPDRLEIKENINKKLIGLRNKVGEPILLQLSDGVENEAENVVKTILKQVKENKYKFKDFALLVRANDHAQPFMRVFDRWKIPYQYLGPGQLFHQEEIKDLIAYLKVLYNFEDSAALYRVICLDVFKLSGTTIAALLNLGKKNHLSLFETLKQKDSLSISAGEKETISKIHDIISRHLSLVSKETAGQILYFFLQETGILQSMIDAQSVSDEQKAQNISRFFEKLKSFDTQSKENSIFAVVDWIDLSMQMGESPAAAEIDWMDNDAVNILTVHSSKGLEFPVVFLVNLIRERFPSRFRREQIPIPPELFKEKLPEGDYHTQEERRLFYVAMTRAKDYLYFTASKYYGGGKRERKLSPFIAESLGKETTEKMQMSIIESSKQLSFLDYVSFSNHSQERDATKISPFFLKYLSYSQIQTFESCPLHYKLRYILKIPTPQTASQSYGTSVHAVLREYYQRQIQHISCTQEDIDTLLKTFWIREGYDSSEHEKLAFAKASRAIQSYLHANSTADTLPYAVEVPFEFYLNKIWVGGRIDRIDTHADGKIEIIDYKTGINIPDEKELKKNLQLTTYALAVSLIREKIFEKKPEDVLLTLSYVEVNKKFTTLRTAEELKLAKQTLLAKAEEISASDFLCNASIFCKNCEYKLLCSV